MKKLNFFFVQSILMPFVLLFSANVHATYPEMLPIWTMGAGISGTSQGDPSAAKLTPAFTPSLEMLFVRFSEINDALSVGNHSDIEIGDGQFTGDFLGGNPGLRMKITPIHIYSNDYESRWNNDLTLFDYDYESPPDRQGLPSEGFLRYLTFGGHLRLAPGFHLNTKASWGSYASSQDLSRDPNHNTTRDVISRDAQFVDASGELSFRSIGGSQLRAGTYYLISQDFTITRQPKEVALAESEQKSLERLGAYAKFETGLFTAGLLYRKDKNRPGYLRLEAGVVLNIYNLNLNQ